MLLLHCGRRAALRAAARRQQQQDQNADDRESHQQLDERKSRAGLPVVEAHRWLLSLYESHGGRLPGAPRVRAKFHQFAPPRVRTQLRHKR